MTKRIVMGKCFQIHIIILNGHTDLTLSCHGSTSDVSINISYLVIHFAFTNYGLPPPIVRTQLVFVQQIYHLFS